MIERRAAWETCSHIWQLRPDHAFEYCVLCGMTIEYRGFLWWRHEVKITDERGGILWRKGQ